MNNALKYVLFATGAAFLFTCSFMAFTVLSGTPMHDVAVIGGFFAAPEAAPDAPDPRLDLVQELQTDKRPTSEVFASASLPLSAFSLASPYTPDELHGLQEELKAQIRANEKRRMDLDERDRAIRLREKHIEERTVEFERFRSKLLETELELAARQDELNRDARTQLELENASWKSMAKIFAEGKAKEQAQRLVLFGPEEAARILRSLPDERAAELIAEIPRDSYREFADAYRRSPSMQGNPSQPK